MPMKAQAGVGWAGCCMRLLIPDLLRWRRATPESWPCHRLRSRRRSHGPIRLKIRIRPHFRRILTLRLLHSQQQRRRPHQSSTHRRPFAHPAVFDTTFSAMSPRSFIPHRSANRHRAINRRSTDSLVRQLRLARQRLQDIGFNLSIRHRRRLRLRNSRTRPSASIPAIKSDDVGRPEITLPCLIRKNPPPPLAAVLFRRTTVVLIQTLLSRKSSAFQHHQKPFYYTRVSSRVELTCGQQ